MAVHTSHPKLHNRLQGQAVPFYAQGAKGGDGANLINRSGGTYNSLANNPASPSGPHGHSHGHSHGAHKKYTPNYVGMGATASAAYDNATDGDQQQQPQQPKGGYVESSKAGTIASVSDTAVGTVGTVSNIANLAMLPVAVAPLALTFASLPASAVALAGYKTPLNKIEKAGQYIEKVSATSAADFGKRWLSKGNQQAFGKFAQGSANVASKVLGPLGHLPGLGEFKSENLKALPKNLKAVPIMHTAMNAAFLTGSLVETYGMARSFSAQVDALRQMHADMTGQDVRNVSSMAALTASDADASVKDARSKLLKITGVRSLATLASVAMIIKSAAINNKLARFGSGVMGMLVSGLAFQMPGKVQEIAEGFVGEPILMVYKGMREAEAAGKQFDVSEIAQYYLLTDENLRGRGATGQKMAVDLAEQDVAAGKTIADITREQYNGVRKQRMEASLAPAPEAPAQAAAPEAPKEFSHVDSLKQRGVASPADTAGLSHAQKVAMRRDAQTVTPSLSV